MGWTIGWICCDVYTYIIVYIKYIFECFILPYVMNYPVSICVYSFP